MSVYKMGALLSSNIDPELQSFRLDGVEATGRELGSGSYATVMELMFRGRRCAGKKLHKVFFASSSDAEKEGVLARFKSECRLLASLEHRHIVQFLGICSCWDREGGLSLPILVMEFLPCTLEQYIDKKGAALEEHVRYAFLRDVGDGLCYLHERNIIHRDLSAKNVLLTETMEAKISDLGVAKIIDLSPEEMASRTSTKCPGTEYYMPPEALVSKSRYTTKLDIFSYGVLMIYVLCGQLPKPSDDYEHVPVSPGRMMLVEEVERRRSYLQIIGESHPLMPQIHRCLHNDPSMRPLAFEVVEQVSVLAPNTTEYPLGRLDMSPPLSPPQKLMKLPVSTLDFTNTTPPPSPPPTDQSPRAPSSPPPIDQLSPLSPPLTDWSPSTSQWLHNRLRSQSQEWSQDLTDSSSSSSHYQNLQGFTRIPLGQPPGLSSLMSSQEAQHFLQPALPPPPSPSPTDWSPSTSRWLHNRLRSQSQEWSQDLTGSSSSLSHYQNLQGFSSPMMQNQEDPEYYQCWSQSLLQRQSKEFQDRLASSSQSPLGQPQELSSPLMSPQEAQDFLKRCSRSLQVQCQSKELLDSQEHLEFPSTGSVSRTSEYKVTP